jgi:hypothetical protein
MAARFGAHMAALCLLIACNMSVKYPTATERKAAHELHLSELIEWRGEVIADRNVREILGVVGAIESTLRAIGVEQNVIDAKRENEAARGGNVILFRDDEQVAASKGDARA